jgi:hypothetical protein
LEGQLLGGDEREAVSQVEAHLMTEHRPCAGAGAIGLLHTGGEDPLQQVVVLAHRLFLFPCPSDLPGGLWWAF